MADGDTTRAVAELRRELTALRERLTRDLDLLEERLRWLEGSVDAGTTTGADARAERRRARREARARRRRSRVSEPSVLGGAAGVPVKAAEKLADERAAGPQPVSEPIQSEDAHPSLLRAGGAFLLSRLGPLAEFAGQGIAAYQHFRKLGKAPVFLMTAFGIVALVLGFAYVLQYTFANVLGEVAKVTLAFVVAAGVVGYGMFLAHRRSEAREFASAILGLGVTLGYLTSYFAASYYSLLGVVPELVVIVLITAGGLVLAYVYETRVVAVISLLGGSLSPLLSAGTAFGGEHYFVIQFVIAVAYVHMAARIRWVALANTSFTVSVIAFESHLLAGRDLGLPIVFSLHAFYYLFAYYVLVARVGHRRLIDRSDVSIATSNLLFFAVALWQAIGNTDELGLVLAGNAVVMLALFGIGLRRLVVEIQSVLLLSSGILCGLTILVLAGVETLGFLWQLEGLLLVIASCRFQLRSVRYEGYSVFTIGLLTSTWQLLVWLAFGFDGEFGRDWVMWFTLGPFVYGLARVLGRYRDDLAPTDERARRVAAEMLSVWLSVFLTVTTLLLSMEFVLTLAIVPLAVLIVRAAKLESEFTGALVMVHFTAIVAQIVLSAIAVESILFRRQTLPGQIAVLEMVACFWLFEWFYERYYPTTRMRPLSRVLRQLFYLLLPVFFLPRVFRSYVEWLPLGLWVSNLIALVVYRLTGSRPMAVESLVLLYLAAAATIYYVVMGDLGTVKSLPFVGSGLALFYLVARWEDGVASYGGLEQPYRQWMALAPHYLAVSGFFAMALMTDEAVVASMAVAIYYGALAYRYPVPGPVRATFRLSYLLGFLLPALVVLQPHDGAWWVPLCSVVAAVPGGYLLYGRPRHRRVLRHLIVPEMVKFWYLHLLVAAIYVSALDVWFDDRFGPLASVLLVAHATALMFTTVIERYRSSLTIALVLYGGATVKVVFFDMADFSILQKVTAFTGIGVVLLFSAYQFQRFKERYLGEKEESLAEVSTGAA